MNRFTVIRSLACPCDECCGENVAEPEVLEFGSLREALEEFESCQNGLLFEPHGRFEGVFASCEPWKENTEFVWFSAVGETYEAESHDDNPVCAEVSLHFARDRRPSPASIRRIGRLLGVRL